MSGNTDLTSFIGPTGPTGAQGVSAVGSVITGASGTTYTLNTPSLSDFLCTNVIYNGNSAILPIAGYGLSGTATAITVDSSGLVYIGGHFTNLAPLALPVTGLNRIAKYNPSTDTFSALAGYGLNNTVYALAVASNGLVYIGGSFSAVGTGGTAVTGLNRIAKYNPTSSTIAGVSANSFAPLARYGLNNIVYALAVASNGLVYIGGTFTAVGTGGTAVTGLNRIAIYNPSTDTFSALAGYGLNNLVNALAVDSSGLLYIGGAFVTVGTGGTAVSGLNRMAIYNPTSSTLAGVSANSFAPVAGNGLNNGVNSLVFDSSGILYIGGTFTAVGGGTAVTGLNYIAKYNPSTDTFSALAGYGLGSNVNAFAFDSNGLLYIGGTFTDVGSVTGILGVYKITTYNPTLDSFTPTFGYGLGNTVSALVFSSGVLYIGGNFGNFNTGGPAVTGINNIVGFKPNNVLSIVYNSNIIIKLYQYGNKATVFYDKNTWNSIL